MRNRKTKNEETAKDYQKMYINLRAKIDDLIERLGKVEYPIIYNGDTSVVHMGKAYSNVKKELKSILEIVED